MTFKVNQFSVLSLKWTCSLCCFGVFDFELGVPWKIKI